MMNVDELSKVDFAALAWEQPAPGVRFKAVTRGDQKLRLVEFTDEFNEPDWCRNGHAGYVLAGTLEIQFADRRVTFRAGEGLFILPGEAEKHRASVTHGCATLILVETA